MKPAQHLRTFTQDLASGTAAEHQTLPLLQSLTPSELFKTPPGHPWDFVSKDSVMEQKDRECFSYTYDTTMLKGLKVIRAEQQNKTVFFIFRFYNGLFYIKYENDLFKTFKTDVKKIRNRIDYIEKEELRYYIPISLLTLLQPIYPKPLFEEC